MSRSVLSACMAIIVLCGPARADLYVASSGNDANPGTQDRPLGTLERARRAVRELRREKPDEPVTVRLAEGTYRLEKGFELGPEDSGTRSAPVVYRGRRGQTRLVGGQVVPPSAFQPVRDKAVLDRLDPAARGNVLQADLKPLGVTDFGEVAPNGRKAEVFFNAKPLTLARWPNEGFVKVMDVVGGQPMKEHGIAGDKVGKFVFEGDRPARWTAEREPWVQGYWFWDWADQYQKVASIDPEKKTITLAPPYHGYGYRKGQRWYAMNLLAELDSPGEWYLDRTAGILYVWPPEPIDKADVILSVLETPLVLMKGVAHVAIRDLTLEATRGAAVEIQGGQANLVADCTIRNTGGTAVVIRGGTGNGVSGSEISGSGAAGIDIAGGDRRTLAAAGNFAVNNHIHHFGRLKRTYAAAIHLGGVGNRAANNLIHHAPHMAIGFGGNENVMELNEIHDVCQETGDVGVFYTGRDWTVRGNVIRHNFIHDVSGPGMYGAQGVYLDDCASGTVVFGNVISKTARAMLLGGGRDNQIENNLVLDCRESIVFDNRGLNWMKYHVEPSGVMPKRLAEMPYREPPWSERYPQLLKLLADDPGAPKGNVLRNNVVWRSKPMQLAKEVVQFGTVSDNLTTDEDLGFTDPAKSKFQLSADSPVFRKLPGFKRIPVEKIGLRGDNPTSDRLSRE